MSRKYISITAAVLTMTLFANPALAVIGCTGAVTSIEQGSDGLVIANWGYGPVDICYLNKDTQMQSSTVVKEACGAIYAQFLTAFSQHGEITSFHQNSTSCQQALQNLPNDYMPFEQPYGYRIGPWPT